MIIMVAVAVPSTPPQHSPMLGHCASSHTVAKFKSFTVCRSLAKSSACLPLGGVTRSQGGFFKVTLEPSRVNGVFDGALTNREKAWHRSDVCVCVHVLSGGARAVYIHDNVLLHKVIKARGVLAALKASLEVFNCTATVAAGSSSSSGSTS